jgi:hypothetical protein
MSQRVETRARALVLTRSSKSYRHSKNILEVCELKSPYLEMVPKISTKLNLMFDFYFFLFYFKRLKTTEEQIRDKFIYYFQINLFNFNITIENIMFCITGT